jgi:hypothetical protein
MAYQSLQKYNTENGVYEVLKPSAFPKITPKQVQNFVFDVAQIAIGATFLTAYVGCQLVKTAVRLAVNQLKDNNLKAVEPIGAQRKEPRFHNPVVITTTVTTVTTTTTTITHQ